MLWNAFCDAYYQVELSIQRFLNGLAYIDANNVAKKCKTSSTLYIVANCIHVITEGYITYEVIGDVGVMQN